MHPRGEERRWRAWSEPKVLQMSLNEAENRAYGRSRSMSEDVTALRLARSFVLRQQHGCKLVAV